MEESVRTCGRFPTEPDYYVGVTSTEEGQSRDVGGFVDASFSPGSRLEGRYSLLRVLAGRQPPVYQAHDDSLDRDVAIYVVPAGQPHILAVARETAQINHGGFVRVFSLGEDEGRAFVVAEWLDAETLRHLLARGYPAPPHVAARIGLELAAAVESAHAQALSHPPVSVDTVLFSHDVPARIQPIALESLPPDHTPREDVRAVALIVRALLTAGGTRPEPRGALHEVIERATDAASDVRRPAQLAAELQPFLSETDEDVATTRPLDPSAPLPATHGPGMPRMVLRGGRALPVTPRVTALAVGALLLLALLALAALHTSLRAYVAPAPYCSRGEAPGFDGGLAQLSQKIGDAMGDAQECAHANPDNGDLLQQTSTGLAFVRKSSGAPIFTNGFEHWSLADGTLVYWMGSSVDPPAGTPSVPGLPGAVRPG